MFDETKNSFDYKPILAKQFDNEAEAAYEEYYELPHLYHERLREINKERFKAMAALRALMRKGSEFLKHAHGRDLVEILDQDLKYATELAALDKQCECLPWSAFNH